MEEFVPFFSREYFCFLAFLGFGRGMDFLSTWVATPGLVLEGNPIAKWLGWKRGAVINVLVVILLAAEPLSAIVVSTASVLVAARNFQSAWLMRSLGEYAYREWMGAQLAQSSRGLYLFCLFGNTGLTLLVGGLLVWFGPVHDADRPIAVGIGMGIIAYAMAVLVFSSLGVWRNWRRC